MCHLENSFLPLKKNRFLPVEAKSCALEAHPHGTLSSSSALSAQLLLSLRCDRTYRNKNNTGVEYYYSPVTQGLN